MITSFYSDTGGIFKQGKTTSKEGDGQTLEQLVLRSTGWQSHGYRIPRKSSGMECILLYRTSILFILTLEGGLVE